MPTQAAAGAAEIIPEEAEEPPAEVLTPEDLSARASRPGCDAKALQVKGPAGAKPALAHLQVCCSCPVAATDVSTAVLIRLVLVRPVVALSPQAQFTLGMRAMTKKRNMPVMSSATAR